MGLDDKTLLVETKDETICKVWMQRFGEFLLVEDNNACGGMNVSFRGAYVRRQAPLSRVVPFRGLCARLLFRASILI